MRQGQASLIVLGILAAAGSVQAQKPALDSVALAHWPRIQGSPQITPDGKYVLYVVRFGHEWYTTGDSSQMVVRATAGAWHFESSMVEQPAFAADGQEVIYRRVNDNLCILRLPGDRATCVPGVQSYQLSAETSNRWLAYRSRSADVTVSDLVLDQVVAYRHVADYSLDGTAGAMLLTIHSAGETDYAVQWVDLATERVVTIWHGAGRPTGFAFDSSGHHAAFFVETTDSARTVAIWHYRAGMDRAQEWVSDSTPGVGKDVAVADDQLTFSPDGEALFFRLRDRTVSLTPEERAVDVNVWSYLDDYPQPEQVGNDRRRYTAVVRGTVGHVVRLEQPIDATWQSNRLNTGGNDDYLVTETDVNSNQGFYRTADRSDIYLVNTENGTRQCVAKHIVWADAHFSPGGRYVYWYDPLLRAYFAYNIRTGVTVRMSKGLAPGPDEHPERHGEFAPYQPIVWLDHDAGLLVGDRYDIWELDPDGIKPPRNVTDDSGRANMIRLCYVHLNEAAVVSDTATVLLCGLDVRSKDNGFFRMKLGQQSPPAKLIMAPALFDFTGSSSLLHTAVVKARHANVYLLIRQSATEYPNLQLTRDFRTFAPMSDLQPQGRYNWLTSELVHWTTFDGRPGQGILYKPQDFDPHRRYPIIFYFYEQLSDQLNEFLQPGFTQGPLNIPYFVSQGYLVLCPDINYRLGSPGEDVYNYVVSAAKTMSREPWVDSRHMAIQGHSWGGSEVNELVTRTRIFAAAAAAAGSTDLVSMYLDEGASGLSGPAVFELSQQRMKGTLWQDPTGYINNSPVFHADRVTTPLLIMQNKDDGATPWYQGVEFFSALRRLGKPVWMLQYDNAGHSLWGEDARDYTIRLNQFFDHYLKGAPAPRWMAVGVPARLKGIDSGLELSSGQHQ